MAAPVIGPVDLRIDVSHVRDAGPRATIAAWLFFPETPRLENDARLVVCVPGQTYDKRYYHLAVPGHAGYSMAEHLARAGQLVIVLDPLGVGESARPPDPATMTPETVAACHHAVTVEALRRMEAGTLAPDLGPIPAPRSVGVGHSMGGMLVIQQQAIHRSHAGIAIFGKSARRAKVLGAAGTSEMARPSAIEGYLTVGRDLLRSTFYWDDVPEAVIAADTKTAVDVPALLAARTNADEVATREAGTIDVPVFLAVGERDIIEHFHDEPRFYSSCPDLTLYVLAKSAHCHNFASNRHQLWDRFLGWISHVV